MVQQSDQLAREVDEELRREQLQRLWELYGTYIIAAAALIIVGVGGVKYYQYRTGLAAEAAGARFAAATHQATETKTEVSRKELEAIATAGPAGYATLARLRLAGSHAAAGKNDDAAREFEAIAKDSNVDTLLRDFAQLQAATLRLDTATWTDMQNRLKDLSAEQNAWRHSARELLGLAANKAGKSEEARQEFQRLLTDRTTPQAISERARIMMGVITQGELAKTPTVTPDKAGKTEAPAGDTKAADTKTPDAKAKADAKKSK